MKTIGILALLLGIISSLFYYLDSHLDSLYIFDPEHLHQISQAAIHLYGNDTPAVVQHIVAELHAKHPRHINLHEEWMFNNAGGAMGAMWILHASVTEYVIIFGTAVGTEGHTGRHTADDYFYVLRGTELAFKPGVYEPEVYPQGSVHLMKRGDVKQYKMESTCFALEYARGWIPPMLGFGYADTFTSTLDFGTLWRTTWITGREMVSNLGKGKL
ncbi:sigma receptor and C-8 sterol isomerase [Amniculicola lignicola CBS 123094]|uniref:C-8 sterol isomerase n=1 Tax=Amniculicola lignicola CBS 123094 TaxID=1392246 RepID=A0A6A5VYG9_9PLEO|nr:sigma receptor and C-8 sterol isomerase [Amniculicola lignicola CBS 123094]